MITINDLNFSYPTGNFLLQIPEFSIEKHEKIAVIGPSGTGKTTLLNLIAGIIMPNRGSIRINDTSVDQLNGAQRRQFRITHIGFVFQDFELLDYLNVNDNILHPYRITRALQLNSAVRERARMLAEEMGIGDKLKRRANDLSQGEKQRAAICRALLTQPRLILAVILVFALSLRLRQREIQTIFKIGCSRMTIVKLIAAEIIIIVFSSAVLCGIMMVAVRSVSNDLVRMLFIR